MNCCVSPLETDVRLPACSMFETLTSVMEVHALYIYAVSRRSSNFATLRLPTCVPPGSPHILYTRLIPPSPTGASGSRLHSM